MSTVTGWRKRTIMEMAQDSGGMFSELPLMDAWVFGDESLEAFAKLVREDALAQPEQEPVIKENT